ncbi:acyltransferase [Hoyosella rhizosphaerae]|uniref:Acyltransferase n=1 Tax=Hoyosella rhizosphaerae TaxID=1755582 RepID=A0A916UC96_9ACTN|nr:acyltransferase [Hoyosella rhizosphaerae]MBN4925834.1 acyltransferase [Hoyosella rhizosphaerae]GGC67587.1 acyltransferase [Hoyosella rhizosphaerae]
MSAATRFAELESYRGIAALSVVIFHAYQTSRITNAYVYEDQFFLDATLRALNHGVAFFFVLSGFLIFLPFAKAALDQTTTPSPRGFLIRRAIRIIPLYYIAIIVVWTTRYWPSTEAWRDLLQHLTFTHVFDNQRIFYTIGPAWSLAIEVMFYVFVLVAGSAVCAWCARVATPSARSTIVVGVILSLIAASVLFKTWAYFVAGIPTSNYVVYFSFPAKLDQFALGMLLAVLYLHNRIHPMFGTKTAVVVGSSGVAAIIATYLYAATTPEAQVFESSVIAIGFVLLMSATVLGPRGSRLERTLATPTLMWLGLISYSVYIWHEPLMLAMSDWRWINFQSSATWPLATALLLVLTMLVGGVSYWVIERSALNIAGLFTREGRLKDPYRAERYGLTPTSPHNRRD